MEKLTIAEFELMEAVWQTKEPIDTIKIIENINNKKDWKKTTVLTILSKLAQKGFISATKSGKSYEYTILIKKEDYVKKETQSFLQKMYNNSVKNLIASLYDNNDICDNDLEDIYELLNKDKGR